MKNKDVMIKITGVSNVYDKGSPPRKDVIEFITEGKISSRGNVTRISYKELEESGLEGGITSLTITPKRVRVERTIGDYVPMHMEFEKGKRYNGEYSTPYGDMGLELLTNDITRTEKIGDPNGKLSIDYSLSLKGLSESNNILEIEILGDRRGENS